MTDSDFPQSPSGRGLDLKALARLLEDEPAAGTPPPPPGSGLSGYGAPGAPPPRRWAVGLVTLLVLVVGTWAVREDRILPSPVAANAPDTAFSSGRAMGRLVDLARAPRPVGSPEHTRVRELILERLEDLGLEPEVQTSLSLRRAGSEVRAVTVRNVVARIPGTASTGTIVLTAHYDAVPLSGGAGDDGTGVVAVLEIARALRAGPPLQNDVLVLITDGEELGLLGGRAFVEEHPRMDDVAVVLSVEMRGGGGPSHMFETGAENGWIVRAMQASDPRPSAGSLHVEVYRRLPNDTDFTPFREAGIQGLNFAAIDRARIYHQPTDVPANVQEETIQHHGMRVLAITRELGRRDLASVHAPDLVYVTLPLVGIVSYPVGRALPISAGIFLLWIGVTVLCARGAGRWKGVVAGLALILIAAMAAWLLGRGLLAWLPRFHPEFGSMTPGFYGESGYVLGLVAGVVALTTALLALARRTFAAAALGAGALVPPVLGALVLAVVAPLAAMELQVAALAGVLAVGVMALGGGAGAHAGAHGPAPRWVRAAALVLALPALAVMVPLLEGLGIAMSFRVAPILGVGAVVALACLVPALDGLGTPNRWWAPLAAACAAALVVGLGLLQAGPSADRPLHSTLLYALDRTTNEALWATREDPGFAWADNVVGPFTGERALTPFLNPLTYRTAPAPIYEIPLPVVRAEEGVDRPVIVRAAGPVAGTEAPAARTAEPMAGGDGPTARSQGPAAGSATRVVRVSVTSESGAELVSLVLEDERAGVLATVNGRPFPPGAQESRVTSVTHQGVPDGLFTVDVEVLEGAESIPLVVVEQHLRPAEYVGPEPFMRPAHLMPSPRGRSDRALVRTPVRVPLDPA